MSETVFFNQNNVSVSNSRFIVYGQTYTMNGVTSVKQAINPAKRTGPIVLGFIGLVMLLAHGSGNKVLGVILIGLAIFWWLKQKDEYIVVLNSSSGETKALSSKDRAFIMGVIEALNQSIIHRG